MSAEQQCFRCHAKGLPPWFWENYPLRGGHDCILRCRKCGWKIMRSTYDRRMQRIQEERGKRKHSRRLKIVADVLQREPAGIPKWGWCHAPKTLKSLVTIGLLFEQRHDGERLIRLHVTTEAIKQLSQGHPA